MDAKSGNKNSLATQVLNNRRQGSSQSRPSVGKPAARGKSRGSITRNEALTKQAPSTPNSFFDARKLNKTEITGIVSNTKIPGTRNSNANTAVRTSVSKEFFTHKRGTADYQRNLSSDKKEMDSRTMEQQAREGAARAMASGSFDDVDSDFKNDTTANSDRGSLQNFSYYGRRFAAATRGNTEHSPASDADMAVMAESMDFHKKVVTAQNLQTAPFQNQLAASGGFGGKKAPEYALEERMNEGLMKQFQGMLTEDVSLEHPTPELQTQHLNSASDFSGYTEPPLGGRRTDRAGHGGSGSRTQLLQRGEYQDANFTPTPAMMARAGGKTQNLMHHQPSKTLTNFSAGHHTSSATRPAGKVGQRKGSSSGTRQKLNSRSGSRKGGAMAQTQQNFMTKNTGPTVNVRNRKSELPPRAQQSPAWKGGLKSKGLPSATPAATYNDPHESPIKNNIYYPRAGEASQVEVLYKKGARSISQRRGDGASANLNLTQANTSTGLTQAEMTQSQQMLMTSSHASMPHHAEERQSAKKEARLAHFHKCKACQRKEMEGHSHEVSASLERKLFKFNQNFDKTGHCKRHRQKNCEQCSRGSSQSRKNGSIGSDDSSSLIPAAILRQHRAAPRSEIGFNRAVAKSVNKPARRPPQLSNKAGPKGKPAIPKFIGRNEDGQRVKSLPREDNLPGEVEELGRDMRRSTKNSEMRHLHGQLLSYGKTGNRPSLGSLPKAQQFTVSQINVAAAGREHSRGDSDDSRGYQYSEADRFVGGRFNREQRTQNPTRLMSSKTANVDRLERAKTLQQSDHADLLDHSIKHLAQEWEGDPHADGFWQKFEEGKREAEQGRMRTLRGMQVQSKQLDVLEAQSNVFKGLREKEELTSERNSTMLGGFTQDRRNNPRLQQQTRNSKMSLFENTVGGDDVICTELDGGESMAQYRNLDAAQAHRILLKGNSTAVLTDYDITDEVGTFQQTGRHLNREIDFRDSNWVDPTNEDRDIADLKAQMEREDRQVGLDLAGDSPGKVGSEQTTPHVKPTSTLRQKVPALDFSGQEPARRQDVDKFDEEEPMKPALDSEDSGSYDVAELEKQPTEVAEESEDGSSGGGQSSRREKKTIGRVTMYDDWLEQQTQKEMARQSCAPTDALASPKSDRLGSDFQKEINRDGERQSKNKTQAAGFEPESKDDQDIVQPATLKMNEALPERPKTRDITIPMNNAERPGGYQGRPRYGTTAIPIPIDPKSAKHFPALNSKSPMITLGKPLFGERSQVSQSSEQIFAGITSEAAKSKASLSFMTSPPKADSKYDDLVMSTSIPELGSRLGGSNKFKQGDIDVPTRFKGAGEEQNAAITERPEEDQPDRTSSLKEISPLSPDTQKSIGKSSPQRPPQLTQDMANQQSAQILEPKGREATQIQGADVARSPAKPPTSPPLKLKNKLAAPDAAFTLQPLQVADPSMQQSLQPSLRSSIERSSQDNSNARNGSALNQTFGSPRPDKDPLEKALRHQRQQSDLVQILSPPKQESPSKTLDQKPAKPPAKQLAPSIRTGQQPTPAKPPIHSAMSPSQPENDSLVDNKIDYANLPKTTLNPTVQDFLQFEDSDDDYGVIFKAHQAKPQADLVESSGTRLKASAAQRIELSPQSRQRTGAKTKTPAMATASEAGLQQVLERAKTSAFMPLQSQGVPPARTPNTSAAPIKAKAQAIAAQQSEQPEGRPGPPRMDSGDEREVDDQINQIDYNVDQEGMSASYYRAHDQQDQRTHQVFSARSSRDMQPASSKGGLTKVGGPISPLDSRDPPSSQPTEQTDPVGHTANILEAAAGQNQGSSDEKQQFSSSKKSPEEQGVRASMIRMMQQSLTGNPPENLRVVPKPSAKPNPKPRQLPKVEGSGSRENLTGQGQYQRPQGVKRMLTKTGRNSATSLGRADSLNESQMSQPELPDKPSKQTIARGDSASRAKAALQAPLKGQAAQKTAVQDDARQAARADRQLRVRGDGSGEKKSSVDRLFSTETVASKMKRNPELYAYNAKEKPPPRAPPKRLARKKSTTPVPNEIPAFIPPVPAPLPPWVPEEPVPPPQSPRQLQLPLEPRLPAEIPPPGLPPLQMRLPEDPPLEPSALILPNLLKPLEPDVPDNDDVYPRVLEFSGAPSSPRSLRKPLEPEEPALPERMLKSSTAEFYCEVLEEPETPEKPAEPEPEADPYLPYPMPPAPFTMPPAEPSAQEEDPLAPALEPPPDGPDLDTPADTEGAVHFLHAKELLVSKSIGVGTQPSKASGGSQYEEFKDALGRSSNPFSVAAGVNEGELEERKGVDLAVGDDEGISDDDNFSVHSAGAPNKVTIGIQTSEQHFRRVEKTQAFLRRQQERIESTDWALSSLFDDISFAKQKKTIGGRKLLAVVPEEKQENCGNQVEEKQITQETVEQILSQIECEYNADQLKRKMQGKDGMEDERLFELYSLGFSTLGALMLVLRLEKEWELSIKQQYQGALAGLDLNASNKGAIIDPEDTIKLLTRCKKMYEAKTAIQRLLKMIVERDQMVEDAQLQANTADDNPNHAQQKAKESLDKIKRYSTRITSQINTLQEEHRIFKRPFILKGVEYLEQMQVDSAILEKAFANKFFVDESGTVKPSGKQ